MVGEQAWSWQLPPRLRAWKLSELWVDSTTRLHPTIPLFLSLFTAHNTRWLHKLRTVVAEMLPSRYRLFLWSSENID